MANPISTSTTSLSNLIGLLLQFVIAVLLGVFLWQQLRDGLPLASESGYFAFVMNNGQGFYARVQSRGPDYLVLDDIWSIRQVVNPETKETTAVLARRAAEVYAPGPMVVLRASLASIEPVGDQSEIAKKIRTLSAQPGS